MIKFDRLEHSKKFVSSPGSRFKEEFHGVVQEDGTIELVSDGFIDWYKEIQADAVGCSVPEIVARAIQGDNTAWRKDSGFYGDVVDMPKTLAEVLNVVNDGRRQFDTLPLDIREKFDYSFEKWFATLGQESWIKNMGMIKEEPVQAPAEEVKE